MIEEFEDFCLYVYTIVDDKCQQLAHLLKRSRPQPKCSDSELIVCRFPWLPFISLSQLPVSGKLIRPNTVKFVPKKETIFGYKLHALTTLNGLLLDFVLAPANESDLQVGLDMLWEQSNITVIGDKAYISVKEKEALWQERPVKLLTLPRKNQHKQLPKATRRLFNSVRQIIETVNGQLGGQFKIETNHSYTFWGLCTRLYSKLTTHTLCIYINRLLGKTDFLQIKQLAFPN